ncbi:MAG: DNA alkylation repair protein [Pseudomonadota bacterium]
MSLLAQLEASANPQKAQEMAAYHKVERPYLGVANPQIDVFVKDFQAQHPVALWVQEADALWQTDVFEARVAAGKLLTKARLRQDEGLVWDTIASWTPSFDSWAIADHASAAGARRLVAEPTRLDAVEAWVQEDGLWQRRAALVMTLPWAKLAHPDEDNLARRERILAWAAQSANDPTWFMQKAIGWWLRTLAKKDPDRVKAFLETHGASMKPFAVREALKPIR